jgi:hypothetical protein
MLVPTRPTYAYFKRLLDINCKKTRQEAETTRSSLSGGGVKIAVVSGNPASQSVSISGSNMNCFSWTRSKPASVEAVGGAARPR